MAMQTSPFFDIKYGWQRGEDGWNVGMDENMVVLSAMISRNIKGFVQTLPAIDIGEIYILTTDGRMYFNVAGRIYSVQAPQNASYFVDGQQYFWDGFTSTESEVITTDEIGTCGAALMRSETPTEGRSVLGLGTMATHDVSEFEDAIGASTEDNYLNGLKNWVNFASSVKSTTLSGLVISTSAVVSTDTVLAAIGKLQGQVDLCAKAESPTLLGVPKAPTAALGTNTDQIATTAFVLANIASKASLASPAFTGVPTAPTAPLGTSTTQLATTAFVQQAVAEVATSSVDTSKVADFTATKNREYWFRQALTMKLPTEASSVIGDRVVFSKAIGVTVRITSNNGTTPIKTELGNDPIIDFSVNARAIVVFNGTTWEI